MKLDNKIKIVLSALFAVATLTARPVAAVPPLSYKVSPVVTWAPAGDHFLLQSSPAVWTVYDQTGSEITSFSRPMEEAAFSPDGRFIAYTIPGKGLYVRDLASGKDTLVEELPGEDAFAHGLHWSGDGSRIFFWSQRLYEDRASTLEYVSVERDGSRRKAHKRQSLPRKPHQPR